MKLYKEETKTTDELVTVSILCNMCGEEIENDNFGYLDKFITIEKTWGYGSPLDGDFHSFELCEKCYNKLLEMLKIPPNAKH